MTKYSGRTDVTDWQDEGVGEQSIITNTTNAHLFRRERRSPKKGLR
jgi:hypothetical protein